MRVHHLPIAQPCHEDWDAMDVVERGRFCQSCTKQVFDLSSMSQAQARGVLREHAGRNICVRYCHDDAGRIRFREPPPRVALATGALAVALAACAPHDNPEVHDRSPAAAIEVPHAERESVAPAVVEQAEPVRPRMGKPVIHPEPYEPSPVLHELKGDIAVAPQPAVKGRVAVPEPPAAEEEPCDPAPGRKAIELGETRMGLVAPL